MQTPTYVFDFDSTLVTVESLDELAGIALDGREDRKQVLRKIEETTTLGMLGNIEFDESLNRRLGLFSANKEHLDMLCKKLLKSISPSVLQNQEWFEENKNSIYVISGGFKEFILPVTDLLGIKSENVFANEFTFDEEGNITGFNKENLLCKPKGKVKQLAKLNLPRPIIAVGDGSSDVEMKLSGAADVFCAFTESAQRPTIVAAADKELKRFEPQLLA